MVSCLTPDDHRRARMGRDDLLLACGTGASAMSNCGFAPPDNVDDGDIGEILVRSPMTMARYWNNPDASGANHYRMAGCGPAISAASMTRVIFTSSTARAT